MFENRNLVFAQKKLDWIYDDKFLNSMITARIWSKPFVLALKHMAIMLQDVYPDRWELRLNFPSNLDDLFGPYFEYFSGTPHSRAQYRVNEVKTRLITPEVYCIIYFPKLTVNNSEGESHDIYDLYARFTIHQQANLKPSVKDICGLRTTLTYSENNVGYSFSHLHRRTLENDLRFTRGCLGSGEIIGLMTLFNVHNDLNYFKLFLFQLECYFSWESIEGTPYVRFNTIRQTSVPAHKQISSLDMLRVYNRILVAIERTSLSKVNLFYDKGVFLISDDNVFEKFLSDILVEIREEGENLLGDKILFCVKGSNNSYYEIQGQSQINAITSSFIFFRGEKKKAKLRKEEGFAEIQIVIRPTLRKYVRTNLERKINENRITRYIHEALYSGDNPGRSQE